MGANLLVVRQFMPHFPVLFLCSQALFLQNVEVFTTVLRRRIVMLFSRRHCLRLDILLGAEPSERAYIF